MGKGTCKQAKKGETGEVARYITRNKAIKRLQVSLPDFRKLCILKGIYPREPKHRRKVQRGSGKIKTFYYKSDIAFLAAEPIIWKLREQKAYAKKKKKLEAKSGLKAAKDYSKSRPFYKLDHLVRERYPTFVDALADLDDALSMCFLFATLAKQSRVSVEIVSLCKRLSVEFLHYVIEAKALRKVFISIKGYYYEISLMGQRIRWLVPHNFTPQAPPDVDLRIMVSFTDFYMTLLGFINYRLYQTLNIYYPPKLVGDTAPDSSEKKEELTAEEEWKNDVVISDKISALNKPLLRSYNEDQDEDEEDETLDAKLVDGTNLEPLRKQAEDLKRQKNLFSGMKFFLNRETNRESLTFVIRCASGEVSWDATLFPGSTYKEDDESITHQIVDRPNVEKKYLSRYYVQPQWVYDCINARMLLPIQDYFPGVELPPHLSPFVSDGSYVPPERKKLIAMQKGEDPKVLYPDLFNEDEEVEEEISDDSDDEEEEEDDEEDEENGEQKTEENGSEKMETDTPEPKEKSAVEKMSVKRGSQMTHFTNPKDYEETLEKRMKTFMIPRKHVHMYKKLKRKEIKRTKRFEKLTKKRADFEQAKKEEKKAQKKKNKSAN